MPSFAESPNQAPHPETALALALAQETIVVSPATASPARRPAPVDIDYMGLGRLTNTRHELSPVRTP